VGKISKNLGKIPENPNKIPKYLGKIRENLGKNGTQRCVTLNMAPNVCRKTSKYHFFGGHTKKWSATFARQLFGQVWENLDKNPLHPQNSLASTPMVLFDDKVCV